MTYYFMSDEQELWGFSVLKDGSYGKGITPFKGKSLKKILDQCYVNKWNLHFFAHIPAIFMTTTKETWQFFLSKEEANKFYNGMVVWDEYPAATLN